MSDTELNELGSGLLVVFLLSYFLPFWIALCREHCRRYSILFANLLVGWTGVGWLFLFFYAIFSDKMPRVAQQTATTAEK